MKTRATAETATNTNDSAPEAEAENYLKLAEKWLGGEDMAYSLRGWTAVTAPSARIKANRRSKYESTSLLMQSQFSRSSKKLCSSIGIDKMAMGLNMTLRTRITAALI